LLHSINFFVYYHLIHLIIMSVLSHPFIYTLIVFFSSFLFIVHWYPIRINAFIPHMLSEHIMVQQCMSYSLYYMLFNLYFIHNTFVLIVIFDILGIRLYFLSSLMPL